MADGTRPELVYASAPGRWVLFTTVLGSALAFVDLTVVNLALPAIGGDLDASFSELNWTVNAYALTLSALILLGGSLGDLLGRRRIFVLGTAWFALASLVCALAPSIEVLVAARALQGVGAAMLTPGSLAIIESSFRKEDRGAAIGAWSGLAAIAGVAGPFLGGYLISAVSWRAIFLINLPLAAVVIVSSARHVPETRNASVQGTRLDFAGAALCALGLAGTTYALSEGPDEGWTTPVVLTTAAIGIFGIAAFLLREQRIEHPMLPLRMFRSRQFSAANAVTFAVYAALSAQLFLLPTELQSVVGYSALQSGAALAPITLVMLVLSPRTGRLSQRIGPRIPMTIGPLIAAGGMLMYARIDAGSTYVLDILPAVLVFAVGLSLTVAPLTTTVLAAAPDDRAGIASAVNNAISRTAGLLSVALIPAAAGISGFAYRDPDLYASGFRKAILMCAALCALGGVIAAITIRSPQTDPNGS